MAAWGRWSDGSSRVADCLSLRFCWAGGWAWSRNGVQQLGGQRRARWLVRKAAEGLSGVSATCLSPLLGRGPARRCRHEPLLRPEWAWGCAGPRRSAVRAGSGERGGWAQGAGHRATAGPSCSPGASVPRPFPRLGRLCGACASALRQPPGPGPRSPQSTPGTAKPWPRAPCGVADGVSVSSREPGSVLTATLCGCGCGCGCRAGGLPRGRELVHARPRGGRGAPPLLLTGDRAFRRRRERGSST